MPPFDEKAKTSDDTFRVQAPQLNLPKGGGAIRGIGEKFAANPVTGTGSLTVPIFTSPGRSGFTPGLSLSYNSGSGNSPFGFGWSLDLPQITRKTDKGLPRYDDANESDTFILSGAEDLMPALTLAGHQWIRDIVPRLVYDKQYSVHRYRPRVEGLFARIERWINNSDATDTFWRSISKQNISTWYGKSAGSRIADPSDPTRIFSWMICESYDDKGNAIAYTYKAEDSVGVDPTQASERNRTELTRSAQRYIKSVSYANRTPYAPDLTKAVPIALPTDWCFQLVFDYGEHDLANPTPDDTKQPWLCRLDPFSSYRATFEVRNYRLCRRALMFHSFSDQPAIGLNCLVRSTDLTHTLTPPLDPTQPFYSYLLSTSQSGYILNSAGGYFSSPLPPVEFEYTQAQVDETVRDIDSESLKNLPQGIDSSNYRWVDLDGEGVSGILTEQGESWFYKPNYSPANAQTIDGARLTLPQFGVVTTIASKPSIASLASSKQQLMNISGDGRLDVVQFDGPTPGFYERTEDADWRPFQTFKYVPKVDWRNPNLKFIDLTGDGFADLLISEDDAFWWHESLSTAGFGPAQRVAQAFDEEKGPQLVFADGTESVFLADMSGDGLTDLVRIRVGEVCYWPNLGYGRFGSKVTMDRAPRFDRYDLFDGHRIRLADIDGSGTVDIIYFASNEVHLYFNQSGNAWGTKYSLEHYPAVETVSSAAALDLLGNGTACLVWSSPLTTNARRPMRYIDLMGGQKPHLLTTVRNNLGAETIVQYAASTKFYVADKLAGTPWVTRLPFPVHVVERVETYDYISRNRFVSQYSYHHGYFDGVEREFRGFGRVDQLDTEEFGALATPSSFPQPSNQDPSSNLPPALTKTWFHTGAFFGRQRISKYLEHEYYSEGDSSEAISGLTPAQLETMLLEDTALPTNVLLPDGTYTAYDFSGEEMREACRSLRGSILRQEIYGLDGSDESDRPYSVSENNYTIEALQPQSPNRYGVFFTHARETIEYHYERKLYKVVGNTLADPNAPPAGAINAADPRVSHSMTLSVDAYGNLLQSASIAYGRRYLDPALNASDQAKQTAILATYSGNSWTNPILTDDSYRVPVIAESSTYELLQFTPALNQAGITNLFDFAEVEVKIQQSSDGAHDITFENLNPSGLNASEVYRRMIGCQRTYYRPDDFGAAAGDENALLALGQLEAHALAGSGYKLAVTPGLISQVYKRGGVSLLPDPKTVLGSTAIDGGGYVDLDADSSWWMPSGRVFYSPAATSPALEQSQAQKNFYLPRRFTDSFGNATAITYDLNNLLPVQVTDAVGNIIVSSNDYRVLQPSEVTNPNGNRNTAAFDTLGLVAGTAVMGKTTETLGDSLATFAADLTQGQIDSFYNAADPHTLASNLLGTATTRIVYDVMRFYNSRQGSPNDPTKWVPSFAATIARETHVSDLGSGQQTLTQIAFSYSDGFGREIQKKVQAEPGPVVDKGPILDPRWAGNGWTIFNNKGKPVRKYEPFFSQLTPGHVFEFAVQVGVSPILCYDPTDRVVATVHPNQTYEKVVFDPWHQESWDVNDTVLQSDPTKDADVGNFLSLLPLADYSPTWFALRTDPGNAAQAALLWPDPVILANEADAANKAAAHANTPSVAYFDPMGRAFLNIADNGGGHTLPTRVQFDIQSNQRSIRDAIVQSGDQQGRIVTSFDFDMLKKVIHQSSMEAAERWMLNDTIGKGIRGWDTRGHNYRTTYDTLRRPTGQFVLGTDAINSDPRTLAAEVLFEKIEYGEGQPAGLNLATRVFRHSDSAGTLTNVGHNLVTGQDEAFDFKGNRLRATRAFFTDYRSLPDLTTLPLTPDTFASSTQYDALNRPTSLTTPDGSVAHVTYNEAALLETVNVNLRGSETGTPFVTNVDYNAKGQRILIEYGNASPRTTYTYDPLTFRLTNIATTRPNTPANQQVVQDLFYSYDPSGNITHVQDDADIQNTVFFRNQRVDPSADYTYDPIYRLIKAEGREQLGLGGDNRPLAPTATSYNDVPRINLTPAQGDGNALGTYIEQYQYDDAGNFLKFIHQGRNPADPGWSRTYSYNETSQFEVGKTNNRLTSTAISGNQPFNELYSYDLHGNMIKMPHLQLMQWNFKDQLLMTIRQAVNASDADGNKHSGQKTFYVYDSAGQRVRKTTESSAGVKIKERFYVGNLELYREYDSDENVTLARETLHVVDDKKRIALVETKTIDSNTAQGSLPNSTTRFQFDNHLGTAYLELDENAAVITYEEYYPYGSTSYQAGRTLAEVSLKRYRYTGKERDEESGFYYHGARYYAAWVGRWTSADPAGIADGPNLYVYVGNSPILRLDKDGREGTEGDTPRRKFNPPEETIKLDPKDGGLPILRTPEWKKAIQEARNYQPHLMSREEFREWLNRPVKQEDDSEVPPDPPKGEPKDDRPDPVPIYSNIANASRTQGKDTSGIEGELVAAKDNNSKWGAQARVAGFYGVTHWLTLGGDVLGNFNGTDSRGASFGGTLRLGSDKDPDELRWYQGFGLIITPRLNSLASGVTASANITLAYSFKQDDWQLDANLYANPASDKTSVGGIFQITTPKILEKYALSLEWGMNRDIGAPDSKFRMQGGLGVTKDTSASTREKSQVSAYVEVVDDQGHPNVFITVGGAFAGTGFLF